MKIYADKRLILKTTRRQEVRLNQTRNKTSSVVRQLPECEDGFVPVKRAVTFRLCSTPFCRDQIDSAGD